MDNCRRYRQTNVKPGGLVGLLMCFGDLIYLVQHAAHYGLKPGSTTIERSSRKLIRLLQHGADRRKQPTASEHLFARQSGRTSFAIVWVGRGSVMVLRNVGSMKLDGFGLVRGKYSEWAAGSTSTTLESDIARWVDRVRIERAQDQRE